MKDAIWKVDSIAGVRYRDPRDEGQGALELVAEPDKAALARMILDEFDSEPIDVATLRRFALLSTIYRPEHVIPTVRKMIKDGVLEIVGSSKAVTTTTLVQRPTTRAAASPVQGPPLTLFNI